MEGLQSELIVGVVANEEDYFAPIYHDIKEGSQFLTQGAVTSFPVMSSEGHLMLTLQVEIKPDES